MDQYRDLNKEMVREVQTMRMNLRLYCDEIVNLKAELMQNRETEISLRKILYKLIVENCLQLTEIVKPDADIIPLLKESITDLSRSKLQRDSNKRTTCTRRSNQLSAELRRSVSIINIGNPIRSISPVRRRISGLADDENVQPNHNTEYEQTAENESEKQPQQDNREQTEHACEEHQDENIATDELITNTYDVIYEESEEDSTANEMSEAESSQDVVEVDIDDDDDDNDSITEVSNNASCTRDTLRDVTNTYSKTMDITCYGTKQNHEQKSKALQNHKNAHQTLDNITGSRASTAMNISGIKEQSKRRPIKNTTKSTDCSASEIEEDTLQEPRRNSRTRELKITNRSIPITTQTYNTSGEEATISSLNFCEATSSTPNSRRKSLSPNTIYVKESLSLSMSTRPVRQCRPKVLVEPKLNTKLRNESSGNLKKRKGKK